jgi:hypothetical protein
MTDEIWRDIPDLEGRYQVSNLGRARSLDRATIDKSHLTADVGLRGESLRCLQILTDIRRYACRAECVGFCKLVLEAFIGPKPDGTEALHDDGNNKNSELTNLCWGTHAKNMQDRVKHGRDVHAKLNPDKVAIIRTSGKSSDELAAEFDVDSRTVRRAKARSTWRHVA